MGTTPVYEEARSLLTILEFNPDVPLVIDAIAGPLVIDAIAGALQRRDDRIAELEQELANMAEAHLLAGHEKAKQARAEERERRLARAGEVPHDAGARQRKLIDGAIRQFPVAA